MKHPKHPLEIEQKIIKQLVADILNANYSIAVFDGKEIAQKWTHNAEEVLAAIGHTEMTYLYLSLNPRMGSTHWLLLIHGNKEDVISDSDNKFPDHLLAKAYKISEQEEVS